MRIHTRVKPASIWLRFLAAGVCAGLAASAGAADAPVLIQAVDIQKELEEVRATMQMSPERKEIVIKGRVNWNSRFVVATKLIFEPGAELVFTQEAQKKQPLYIIADSVESRNPQMPGLVSWQSPKALEAVPTMAPDAANGVDGVEGRAGSATFKIRDLRVRVRQVGEVKPTAGSPGERGAPGSDGSSGSPAPSLMVFAEATSERAVKFRWSGQSGEKGGRGQNGGKGGDGGNGARAVQTGWECSFVAQGGASGGSGGDGGAGGRGGRGGDGGVVTMVAPVKAHALVVKSVEVDVNGGLGGPGGEGGHGGKFGEGGYAGSNAKPACQGKGNAGPDGQAGKDGEPGPSGEKGDQGSFRTVSLQEDMYYDFVAKPHAPWYKFWAQ